MKNFNCPKCSANFNFVHICPKSNFALRWYKGCLRIGLLDSGAEYHDYEFSSTEEEVQEKINKFIDNLLFI